MKIVFFLFISVVCINTSFGQKLRFEPNVWSGPKFYENEREITEAQIVEKIESDSTAAEILGNYKIKSATTFAGSIVVGVIAGWQLGVVVNDNDPDWLMLGLGAIITAGSLSLDVSAGNDLNLAIAEYNKRH